MPLLLLDIDGVLCPLGPGPGELMRTLVVPPHDIPVTYSEKLSVRLDRLSESFELVWATAWVQDANRTLGPELGLPPLPVIDFTGWSALRIPTWKLPAVKRFVADRSVAWVDDDLGHDAHEWARRRTKPTLLLDIDPGSGLAEQHIETLAEFANQLPSALAQGD
jgi:Swiss Army Knife RNA repair-like protein